MFLDRCEIAINRDQTVYEFISEGQLVDKTLTIKPLLYGNVNRRCFLCVFFIR